MFLSNCSSFPQKNRKHGQLLSHDYRVIGVGNLQRGEFRKFAICMEVIRENIAGDASCCAYYQIYTV